MKLPLVSRKKYEIALENYRIASEGQRQVKFSYSEYQLKALEKQNKMKLAYSQMEDSNKMLVSNLEICQFEMEKLKKEIKRLKFLLSKNNISYDGKVTKKETKKKRTSRKKEVKDGE